MSLFDRSVATESHHFPTEPAFIVRVVVRNTPQYGLGHHGVFAAAPIAAGTKLWVWTDRVEKIHCTKLDVYIAKHFDDDEMIRVFLQQGFVLPGEENHDYFCSNPTDAGRFMNHSQSPNCGPDGTLCYVAEGEELTMDYGFHGNPEWYRDLCRKYGVKTEAEVSRQSREQYDVAMV